MRDEQKTKKQLIDELKALRRQGKECDSPVFESIIERIPLGIAVLRLDEPRDPGSLRYLYRNPAADQATRSTLHQVVGTTIRDSFPQLLETELPAIFASVVHTGESKGLGEFRYGDENVPDTVFSLDVFPLGGNHVGVSFENITEMKLAQEAREEALAVLESATKERSQRLAVEQSALAEIGRIVSSSRNIEEVYERFADEVRKLISFDRILIAIINPDQGTASIPYASGIAVPGGPERENSRLADTLAGQVVESSATVLVTANGEDEVGELAKRFRLLSPALKAGIRTFLAIPLASKDQIMGVLFLGSRKPSAYGERQIRLAENIAGQISGTIANTQLFDQLEAGHNRLRSLTQQVIQAQEEERRQVSRELHDEAGQALTALKLSLQLVESELTNGTQAVRERIKGAVGLTDATMENIRLLARGLRPLELDALGLPRTLEGYCREFADLTDISIEYSGYEAIQLSEATNICLYRYLQEALTNVAKHARAQQVRVDLSSHGGEVRLTVSDDGRGFARKAHPREGHKSQGIGLLGMRERFEALGGRIEIDSTAGRGTRLAAYVPVQESK